jgi:hypothetical protein
LMLPHWGYARCASQQIWRPMSQLGHSRLSRSEHKSSCVRFAPKSDPSVSGLATSDMQAVFEVHCAVIRADLAFRASPVGGRRLPGRTFHLLG